VIKLRARALRLLALREHSRTELRAKLARAPRGGEAPSAELIDALLDALQAQGLLDEARFAAALVRRRQARFGAERIVRELRSHGLEEDLVEAALRDARQQGPSELEQALRALRKRHPLPAGDARERARQQRFLLARGFSHASVREALQQHSGPAEPDAGDTES
jgi:regulatory protein